MLFFLFPVNVRLTISIGNGYLKPLSYPPMLHNLILELLNRGGHLSVLELKLS
jgi:hypothetical protein